MMKVEAQKVKAPKERSHAYRAGYYFGKVVKIAFFAVVVFFLITYVWG